MLDQSDRIMHIESPLGESRCAVTGLSGEERVNDLYSFQVSIVAENDPISPDQILGEMVTVTIKYESLERLVYGVVCRFEELDPVGQNMFEYSLEIAPPLWLLGLSSHTRIFEEMTTTDIVKSVISDGCKNMSIDISINTRFEPRETCLQYQESDLDFVLRLLAEDGVSFFFKHSSGSVTMVLTDADTGFSDCAPASYPYSERSNADWRQQVSAFRRSGRLATGKLENFDYSEYSAPDPRASTQSSKTKGKLRPGSFQSHAGHYFQRQGTDRLLVTGDCDTRVTRWLEGMEADAEYYTGESAAPTLTAGHKMSLEDAPACASGEKNFLLLEVFHSASEGVDMPAFYSNRVRCAPSSNKVAFRPTYTGEAPRIWGVQSAKVVEVRPIPGTGVHAEVKVKFPWDAKGVSCWARVAQLYAGNKWGGYFVPELDQEVLVEFIAGNPERPVIVGAVYNSKNPIPPYNKWQSGIRTRSKQYNELLFTDEDGEEKFYTEAGKDYEFLVHNDRTGKVENNDTLEVLNERSVTVTQNYTEVVTEGDYSKTLDQGNYTATIDKGDYKTLVNAGKYTADVMKAVMIESKDSITLKVGGNSIKINNQGVTISATKIDIKANTVTTVEGSATLVLKGGMVNIN